MQKQKEEMEKCSKDSEELYIVNEFKNILDVLISEISKLKNLKTDSELTEKIIIGKPECHKGTITNIDL